MRINVSFQPRSWENEAGMVGNLNRIAVKSGGVSGYCFGDGSRDYAFRNLVKARAFVRAAKRLHGVRAETSK